jgi:hypothetical protein
LGRARRSSASREAAKECSPRRKPWERDAKENKLPRSERNVSHTAGNVVLHLIFSTKDRQPFITAFFCRFAARRDPPFGGVKYWSKP